MAPLLSDIYCTKKCNRGHTFAPSLAPDAAHERGTDVEVELEMLGRRLKQLVLVASPLQCAVGALVDSRHGLVLEGSGLEE